MHEIWLLWTFRDVAIVRHLDWHVAFNAPLTTMADVIFIRPQDYVRHGTRVTQKPNQAVCFLETLEAVYKKGLATHKTTIKAGRS